MASDFHTILVPTAERYLQRLDAMLEKLGVHVAENGLDEQAVLDIRLQAGMLPLRAQARTTMDFPFRAVRQMLGRPFVIDQPDMGSIAGLRHGIDRRLEVLASIEPGELRDVVLTDKAGDGTVERDAVSFLSLYLLPNFFFHLCAVYFTLRIMGVRLGKQDFDGFHVYPAEWGGG